MATAHTGQQREHFCREKLGALGQKAMTFLRRMLSCWFEGRTYQVEQARCTEAHILPQQCANVLFPKVLSLSFCSWRPNDRKNKGWYDQSCHVFRRTCMQTWVSSKVRLETCSIAVQEVTVLLLWFYLKSLRLATSKKYTNYLCLVYMIKLVVFMLHCNIQNNTNSIAYFCGTSNFIRIWTHSADERPIFVTPLF